MVVIAIIGGAFLTGALAGVLVVIAIGIAREDRRDGLLPGQAPTALTAGVRRMSGLHVHVPQANALPHAWPAARPAGRR
jgi:hypothetical protein